MCTPKKHSGKQGFLIYWDLQREGGSLIERGIGLKRDRGIEFNRGREDGLIEGGRGLVNERMNFIIIFLFYRC